MLSDAVNRHIELYRSMGFKYKVQAYMLHSFAAFAESRSEQFIQTDTVLEWAKSAPSPRQRYDRLLTVRRLACSLNAEDERHQVPPDRCLRPRAKEASDLPYFHSGRNRSSSANRRTTHIQEIDTAGDIQGNIVSDRLHWAPGLGGFEAPTLGYYRKRTAHSGHEIPEEPSCSTSCDRE